LFNTLRSIGKYSIKDLEVLSGVKAHTIRIWEQRYGLLKPQRSDTNIRYYDDEQLKRILNISLLVKNGLKISKVSSLSDQELSSNLVSMLNDAAGDAAIDDHLNTLVIAMIELDEALFDRIFASSVLRIGFEHTITRLIYPFLERVGMMWSLGDVHPAQEHFVSNLIRQKIIVAIDGQKPAPANAPSFLLFLPEGELHEVGLLIANYLIRQSGRRTIYLGQNVPMENIPDICEKCSPQCVLFFITIPKSEEQWALFSSILGSLPSQLQVYASGHIPAFHTLPANVQLLKSMGDLLAIL
jgi:MerR family transcriptional regulator, light-induced transcriptional regulator